MNRLRALWWRVSGSLWFVPALTVLGAVLLAAVLIEAEGLHDLRLRERWPRLFGAGADGSREMLSAIAGSMITVAGVVFSVTIVALSLASSQYSPRVLRAFMNDRPTQLVLGVFVGVFAYCLVVLRTIRGGGEEAFVPSLAVLFGIVLAFVGIAFLVFFIHHLAASIEVASILERVTGATVHAVDALFPQELGLPASPSPDAEPDLPPDWTPVFASSTGYIVSVDDDGLLAFARKYGRIVRMELGVGAFVIEGQTLVSVQGGRAASAAQVKALNACYSLGHQRTTEQDAEFGVQQIVDIGVKALSPGINDPTTAVMCIDRLTQIMVRLARRRIETRYRRDADAVRVIAVGPSFASLAALAYGALREHARGNSVVLARLQWSAEQVAAATSDSGRLRALTDERARTRRCGDGEPSRPA